MDTEKFLKSSFAQKLLADAGNMEEDVKAFNLLYNQFLEHDAAAVGVILRCHLIVEHFLDRYLAAANPGIREWGRARLTFAQKIALVDHPRSVFHMVMDGLKCLNRLRNLAAHALSVRLEEADLEPIRSFISMWYSALGKPIPDGLSLVEAFSLVVSSWLYGHACMIQRHTPEHGFTEMLNWGRIDDG
jgi:hypothetical protein